MLMYRLLEGFITSFVLNSLFEVWLILLCVFILSSVHSGSFVHDADIKMGDWKPSTVCIHPVYFYMTVVHISHFHGMVSFEFVT